jgi:hypothetical protein
MSKRRKEIRRKGLTNRENFAAKPLEKNIFKEAEDAKLSENRKG